MHIWTIIAEFAVVLAVCAALDHIPWFNKAYDRTASTVIVVGTLGALCFLVGGWVSVLFLVPVLAAGNDWGRR